MTLSCFLGLHRWGWAFVGDRDNPDLHVRACRSCGREKSSRPAPHAHSCRCQDCCSEAFTEQENQR